MMNSFTNAQAMRGDTKHEFEPMFVSQVPHKSPRKKALNDEDLVAARAEGFNQGQAEANAGIDRASGEALRAIANMMQMMLGRLGDEATSLRHDAAEVAVAAAKIVATTALDAFGEEAIEDIVQTAIAQLRDVPRLIVRVAPELVESIEARLAGCAREAGFVGEIVVRGDLDARNGDCVLDWGDASITHNRESAFAAIEKAAEKWRQSAQAEGFQIDMFQT
jgi:flagellar assembly protein FliH